MAIKMVKSRNPQYQDGIAVNVPSRSINCEVRTRESDRGLQQSTILAGRLVFLNREHEALSRPEVEAKVLQILVGNVWMDLLINGQANPDIPVDYDRIISGEEANSLFDE